MAGAVTIGAETGNGVKVALFVPCIVDATAPATAVAAARVLERLGCQVHVDRRQTCCGQAPFNAGFRREALALARRFVHIFGEAEAVVAPSGSCVSMVRKHYLHLPWDDGERGDMEALRGRVWELTEFIVSVLGVRDVGAWFPHRVAYHPSCHLSRDLGVTEAPEVLLRHVKGLEAVEAAAGASCCGFGGVFHLRYPELSRAMAYRRAGDLAARSPEFVTGNDDSCLHHLSLAFRRLRLPLRTIHIAEILAAEPK